MKENTPSVPDSARDIATEYVVGWQCIHNDDERKASIEHLAEVLTNFGRAQYERGRQAKLELVKGCPDEQDYRDGFKSGIEKAAEVCDKHAAIHKEFDGTWQALAETYAAEIRDLLPKEGAKG